MKGTVLAVYCTILLTILSAGSRRFDTLCTVRLSLILKRSWPPDDQHASTLGWAAIARILEKVFKERVFVPARPVPVCGRRPLLPGGKGLLVLENQATIFSDGEARNDRLSLPVLGRKDVGMLKHTVDRRDVLQVPTLHSPSQDGQQDLVEDLVLDCPGVCLLLARQLDSINSDTPCCSMALSLNVRESIWRSLSSMALTSSVFFSFEGFRRPSRQNTLAGRSFREARDFSMLSSFVLSPTMMSSSCFFVCCVVIL